MRNFKSFNSYSYTKQSEYESNSNQLNKHIKNLAENYELKFSEAKNIPHINESIEYISKINMINNHEIIQSILKEYRPSQIFPNTIGSFLFGCLQQNYGDVSVECSPLCSYGIKNNNELKPEKCSNQIYVQHNDELNSRFFKLNDCESRQAYVFVYINFMGFTQQEKVYFKKNGIFKIQILVTQNSKHHVIIKMRDIDDLPTIQEYEGLTYAASNSGFRDEVDENAENENTYIYLILFGVIIVMIAAMYSRNPLTV